VGGTAGIRRLLGIVAVLLAATAAAACTPAAQAAGPASSASQSPLPPGLTLPPVPAQLWGTWQPTVKVTGTGPLMLNLVFSAHSFAFYDDDMNTGAIDRAWAVGADQIRFNNRGACDTAGTYTWKVTGDRLTLSGGTDDECPRRVPLTTRVWKKVSNSTAPADTNATQ
jgi:hypothetical protein